MSERLPDGKRVTKRLKKLRPDLDQCPNGLAMADSTNHDKTRESLLREGRAVTWTMGSVLPRCAHFAARPCSAPDRSGDLAWAHDGRYQARCGPAAGR